MSHSVIYNKIFGSDIFNTVQQPLPPQKPVRPSLLRDYSDIFNTKTKDLKRARIRNHSQSDIFFTEGKSIESYDSYHPKVNYDSDYNPDNYLKHNTSYSMKMKEMYDIEPNKSESNITSSKGYLEFMDVEQNIPDSVRNKKRNQSFNRKKVNLYIKNRTFNPLGKPRDQLITDLSSNIFNEPVVEKKNMVIKPQKFYKESKKASNVNQPKVLNRNKWLSKLDWKNPKGEILFKHYTNDKSAEKQSAFDRKMHDMEDNVLNYSDIHPKTERKQKTNFKRLNDYSKEKVPSGLSAAKEKKVKENVSGLFSNDNFYENNFKLKKIPNDSFIEKSYIINNAGNLEKKDLIKLYHDKGIHVYNVKEEADNVFNGSNKKKYTFKVREIKGEGKTFENASKDLKNKYKEIDIVPEKKICVNKRIYAESYAGNRDVYKYNENNTSEKPKTVKKNNDINRKFTNQYKNVNYAYKSNLLRKQMNF